MQRGRTISKQERRRQAEELDVQITALLSDGRFTEAVKVAIDNLGPELRGYFRAVSGVFDGDDLYQSLCIAIWQGLPRFRGQSKVHTWVYGIAHNIYWQWLRDHWRKHAEHLATTEEERLPAPSLSSLIREAENRRLLSQLREQLTAVELEIYILRAERGFDFPELADLLQISEETARQRYHRAKERLKQALRALSPS